MPKDRLDRALSAAVAELEADGRAKGAETEIVAVLPAAEERGPRVLLAGEGDREFLRMNSNGYLGLADRAELKTAEEEATAAFGAGPGAVRFISGTYRPHLELERELAAFHGREAGMIFSSAYATVVGVLAPLTSPATAIVSDELNHNCIINAMRLARPKVKRIYKHSDMADLEAKLAECVGEADRVVVVTDGIFSMRGDWAPLAEMMDLARKFDAEFPQNVAVMTDDSHGVGAFGATGRGTEEHTGAPASDILVGTLGKAFGVNGGYVVGSAALVRYLRETAPMYIYSNPITVGEAAAARAALRLVDSEEGHRLLEHLRSMTARFEQGLVDLGFETIPGEHPVVPLVVRDTPRTAALVEHLFEHGVLATGLNYPVVPKGDEEIRFQISAAHTVADVDLALEVLESFGAPTA